MNSVFVRDPDRNVIEFDEYRVTILHRVLFRLMTRSTLTTSTPNRSGYTNVVFVVCAALFFSVLSSSGVTVILPEMSAVFSVNAGQLSWVMAVLRVQGPPTDETAVFTASSAPSPLLPTRRSTTSTATAPIHLFQ